MSLLQELQEDIASRALRREQAQQRRLRTYDNPAAVAATLAEAVRTGTVVAPIALSMFVGYREDFYGGMVLWLGTDAVADLSPDMRMQLPLMSPERKGKHLFRLTVWRVEGEGDVVDLTTIPDGTEIYVPRVTGLKVYEQVAQGNANRLDVVNNVADDDGAEDNSALVPAEMRQRDDSELSDGAIDARGPPTAAGPLVPTETPVVSEHEQDGASGDGELAVTAGDLGGTTDSRGSAQPVGITLPETSDPADVAPTPHKMAHPAVPIPSFMEMTHPGVDVVGVQSPTEYTAANRPGTPLAGEPPIGTTERTDTAEEDGEALGFASVGGARMDATTPSEPEPRPSTLDEASAQAVKKKGKTYKKTRLA